MALTRSERFKLKTQLIEEMNSDNSAWDVQRKNLLLGEFGLEPLGDGWNEPSFEDLIVNILDSDLIEMYAIVTGVEKAHVADVVEAAEPGNWKFGYVRLFISHSAKHREFVGEVARELAVTGIHGFVAHDTMTYSQPWQTQIEQALKTMQAFVALTHAEFLDSPWCHQETGWALGRRVPRYIVRIGAEPAGFIGREQWPSGQGLNENELAGLISKWASSIPELSETMTDGLFRALESAGNYFDAGATAERIASLSGLTEEQWQRLDEIWWRNDQLYTGYLPSQALRPFYEMHGRQWPPSRVTEATSKAGAWPVPAATDEPPF